MKTNFCGDRWGRNKSSAGKGGDESKTGWGRLEMETKSAGMGGTHVISVPV